MNQNSEIYNKEILFSIHRPMISSSHDATETGRLYKLLIGKSGKRWVVAVQENAEDNIYVDGGKGSRGMAGRILTFPLEDGDTVDFEGPWHVAANGLFEDTGYDVRGKMLITGIVALKREKGNKYCDPDKYSEIILYDEKPIIGSFEKYRKIAQEYANKNKVEVFEACLGLSLGSSGSCKPEKE